MPFDALLLLSFGGPDGPGDVEPFLTNVLRGRPAPQERVAEVASHYMRFGGRSPINAHNRALLEALSRELTAPVYWGNRNWRPYLADTVRCMAADGVRRAAVFVTSAYSSYSGCRQYLEDIERARAEVGPTAPELVKIRPYYDHPGFVVPLAEGLSRAVEDAGGSAPILMSAHSIPDAMAAGCRYREQLAVTGAAVAAAAGVGPGRWRQVYQSRSGPPSQHWLGPDILDVIASLPPGTGAVVAAPIGFVSDHMEVAFDLDVRAAEAASAVGARLVRSPTPGTHPRFVAMVGELMDELDGAAPPWPGCGPGCCPRAIP